MASSCRFRGRLNERCIEIPSVILSNYRRRASCQHTLGHSNLQANSPRYYRIDRNATLEATLKKKEVVEYPTFIVALHVEGFDLVEGQGGGAGLSETPALDGRMSGS